MSFGQNIRSECLVLQLESYFLLSKTYVLSSATFAKHLVLLSKTPIL